MSMKNNIVEYLSNEEKSKINNMFNDLGKNDEMEFTFASKGKTFRINPEHYKKIIDYMGMISKRNKLKLDTINTLDISYNDGTNDKTYRISILGNDKINEYINSMSKRKNHIIFKTLLETKDKNIELSSKRRNKENIVDMNEFNIRVKSFEENSITNDEIKTKLKEIPKPDDAADAIAVEICSANTN